MLTLVTGASGFIGSHLINAMAENGIRYSAVSRHPTTGVSKITSYKLGADWQPLLKDVSCIVHLAARVHVLRETARDPLAQFKEANIETTVDLANQAAASGVRRFVFLSSIKVNGESTFPGRPFTHLDSPCPVDDYGRSKAEAEEALSHIGKKTGMEITIIRPALVYGPGVGGNFRTLMKWASSGAPSLFGAVENKRSLLYVHALTRLIITALSHPAAGNRCFLASDPRPVSTHEMLSGIAEGYGKTIRSIPVPETVMRLAGYIARPQLAQRLLGNLEVDARDTYETLNLNEPSDTLNNIRDMVRFELQEIKHS